MYRFAEQRRLYFHDLIIRIEYRIRVPFQFIVLHQVICLKWAASICSSARTRELFMPFCSQGFLTASSLRLRPVKVQPFTPPTVRPDMNAFWFRINTIMIGITDMTAPDRSRS